MVARRFTVEGRVQGVGYRFFAMRAAARHQVTGTVKNLPDGNVEVIAQGPRKSVEEFKLDLAAGPSNAYVTQVEELDIPVESQRKAFLIDY
jgi:acylphosphatase